MSNTIKRWALAAVAFLSGLQMASTAVGFPVIIFEGKILVLLAGIALIWTGILLSPFSIKKTL